jgi:hypothetical protein
MTEDSIPLSQSEASMLREGLPLAELARFLKKPETLSSCWQTPSSELGEFNPRPAGLTRQGKVATWAS